MTIALKLCVLESSPRNNFDFVLDFMGRMVATACALVTKNGDMTGGGFVIG
jgi:hypothetical protein